MPSSATASRPRFSFVCRSFKVFMFDAVRSLTSNRGTRKDSAASLSSASTRFMYASASKLVTASMRRRFAPTLVSEVILTKPISLVAETWVPPHSSCEKPSMSSTRTNSPYFSPNSAMTPASRADASDVS